MGNLFNSVAHIEGAMTFHRRRHAVLAGNVANVDTPGYEPLDIERIGRPGSREFASAPLRVFSDAGELRSADGNAVNLERELSKIDANRIRFDTSSALVSRRLAILKYAATDGVG